MNEKNYDDEMIIDGDGCERFVGFIHKYKLVVDPCYGADADGKGGIKTLFLEDECLDEIVVWDSNMRQWMDIELYHPDEQDSIRSGIWKFLEYQQAHTF